MKGSEPTSDAATKPVVVRCDVVADALASICGGESTRGAAAAGSSRPGGDGPGAPAQRGDVPVRGERGGVAHEGFATPGGGGNPSFGYGDGDGDDSPKADTAEEGWIVMADDGEQDEGEADLPDGPPSDSVFQRALEADVCDLGHLRQLSWRGVPCKFRPMAWKLLCGYIPVEKSERESCLQRKRELYFHLVDVHDCPPSSVNSLPPDKKKIFLEISVDLPRTLATGFEVFCGIPEVQKILGRINLVWSLHNKRVSYFQGLSDWVLLLLLCMISEHSLFQGDVSAIALLGDKCIELLQHSSPDFLRNVEADVFWLLSYMMDEMKYFLEDHFENGVTCLLDKMAYLIDLADKEISDYLNKLECRPGHYAFRWIVCLMTREFLVPQTLLIWDAYLAQMTGFPDFNVYVSATLLITCMKELKFKRNGLSNVDFSELLYSLQRLPVTDWTPNQLSRLLQRAHHLVQRDLANVQLPITDPESQITSNTTTTTATAATSTTSSSTAHNKSLVHRAARSLGDTYHTALANTKNYQMVCQRVVVNLVLQSVSLLLLIVAAITHIVIMCLLTLRKIIARKRS
ncbi:GTPase-activating protein GYP1 [Pelomyxa schiedti]|nr:GTPase-activating protein GYP1 [Pelomyxa schiedti]